MTGSDEAGPPGAAGADGPAGVAGATGGTGAQGGSAQGGGSFRVVVLASGSGTNLQALIDKLHGRAAGAAADGAMPAGDVAKAAKPGVAAAAAAGAAPVIEIALVVSDQPAARALERARAAGIPTAVVPAKDFATRADHDRALIAAVAAAEPDLVVLAGYMRLVAPEFLEAFPSRVINLHPALLPSFPGTSSIEDAVRHGVKVTGVTVHYVDEGLDTGPTIAQEAVRVEAGDTAESLAARIHAVEHELLPAVVDLIAAGKVRLPLPGTRVVQVDWSGGKGVGPAE
jgi:phosphoribosylglycinamide formyltransferase-1